MKCPATRNLQNLYGGKMLEKAALFIISLRNWNRKWSRFAAEF
jgi:hypothetical protein